MILDDIRADVDARFRTGEFMPRLFEALYEHALRKEMKHLWDGAWHSGDDFKGADKYRLYVREKIRVAQRLRWWEDMYNAYSCFASIRGVPATNPSEQEALEMVMSLEAQQRKLAEKRLALREKIGEINYDT